MMSNAALIRRAHGRNVLRKRREACERMRAALLAAIRRNDADDAALLATGLVREIRLTQWTEARLIGQPFMPGPTMQQVLWTDFTRQRPATE